MRFGMMLSAKQLKVVPAQAYSWVTHLHRVKVYLVMHYLPRRVSSILQALLAQATFAFSVCLSAILPRFALVKFCLPRFHSKKESGAS